MGSMFPVCLFLLHHDSPPHEYWLLLDDFTVGTLIALTPEQKGICAAFWEKTARKGRKAGPIGLILRHDGDPQDCGLKAF
jgi:hypothetical protein